MIEDKKALAETVVGTGENWLTEMTYGRFDVGELVRV